jgi:AraC family transcriptional regulator
MMEPKIVHREAFTVVGMKCRSKPGEDPIPRLWDEFNPRCADIPNALLERGCYGIEFYEGDDDPSGEYFSYLASIEVSGVEELPGGMRSMRIPEADYAVFEHRGPLNTLMQTFQSIFRDWMPGSGYRMPGNLDFEYYDHRFKYNEPDSVMEIWIPVEKV